MASTLEAIKHALSDGYAAIAPFIMHVKTDGRAAPIVNISVTVLFGVISGIAGGYMVTVLQVQQNETNIENIKNSVQRLERQLDRVIDRQIRDGRNERRKGILNEGPVSLDGTAFAAFSWPHHRVHAQGAEQDH